MTDFSFYLCPKCGYNSKIIGDDLVEKYHRKVNREFLDKLIKKAESIKPMSGGQSINSQKYRHYYKKNLLKFLTGEKKELEGEKE